MDHRVLSCDQPGESEQTPGLNSFVCLTPQFVLLCHQIYQIGSLLSLSLPLTPHEEKEAPWGKYLACPVKA